MWPSGLKSGDVDLSGVVICSDGPECLQVVAHYRVVDVNGRALRSNLQLAGNAGSAVARDNVCGVWPTYLLVRGCGSLSGIRRIQPTHRVAVGIRDLLEQDQVRSWRQKPRIEHSRGKDHLVNEVILLLCDVVRL